MIALWLLACRTLQRFFRQCIHKASSSHSLLAALEASQPTWELDIVERDAKGSEKRTWEEVRRVVIVYLSCYQVRKLNRLVYYLIVQLFYQTLIEGIVGVCFHSLQSVSLPAKYSKACTNQNCDGKRLTNFILFDFISFFLFFLMLTSTAQKLIQPLPQTHFNKGEGKRILLGIGKTIDVFGANSGDQNKSMFMDENGVVDDMDGYLNYLSLEYDSVWDTKPSWCQPWTIVLTGALVIVCSWLIFHSLLASTVVSLLVCTWWYIFLYSYPKAYTDMIAERRKKVRNGTEDTFGLDRSQ